VRSTIQRFVVTAELGRGGMGVVYLARDPQLERDVAIKVIEGIAAPAGRLGPLSTHATIDLREGAPAQGDPLAEARMMARLSHPNVLPIYEVGLEGDRVFLVMEVAAGGSLRAGL
jgi:serine/threonine protein kinase